MEAPLLLTAETSQYEALLSGIMVLHASCIMHDHTLATFLPPLSHETMYQWWRERLDEVKTGHRRIIVQLMPVSNRTADVESPFPSLGWQTIQVNGANDKSVEMEVAGVVALDKPESQTGPFRGLVEKLLVSPNHRRKGIARRIMAKLEEVARLDGRWNLMLDTVIGTPAEKVYPALGYTTVGTVQEYGIHPSDGHLVDEIWFWKDLRKNAPL